MTTLPRTLALAFAAAAALSACRPSVDEQASAPAPLPASPRATIAQAAPAPSSTPATPRAVPGDAVNDSIISARIKAGILSDPGMSGADVSVNTDHGVVSLTGQIKSQEQAAIASAHAQRPDGVMRVDNQLAVNLH